MLRGTIIYTERKVGRKMIARILYHTTPEKKGFPSEHLVEFESVFISHSPTIGETPESVSFVFATVSGQERNFVIQKDGTAEMYLMNNDGKTVDSYRW